MLATLVLTNGCVYTMDGRRLRATAVAIRDDEILAVGDDEEMKSLLGEGGEWVDLGGRCVTPGLVDAHVHFQGYALSLQRVNLVGTRSVEEAIERVREQVAGDRRPFGSLRAGSGTGDQGGVAAGQGWLQGRGWAQDEWVGRGFPTAAHLDSVAPHVPVCLRDKSGHAAWVNSRALHIAGIDANTPDPPGGQIQRDGSGRPTGILFEEAIDLVADHIPATTTAQLAAAMVQAQRRCWEAGLTGIHDFDGRSCFQALQMLRENGELGLRVVKNIPVYRLDHAIGVGLRSGFGDEWVRIGGVKIFADGALGPRTAAMIAPYENEPENYGLVVTDKEEMMGYASRASANGLSVTVHAIGDRANHDVLDVYEALREEEKERVDSGQWTVDSEQWSAPVSNLRHRIEHVQVLHPGDVARLARLNVIASMQPVHATSDMEMADRYWGDRARYSYAWRTVLESGATLVFGSDAPVEAIEPLPGIYAAVTRRRANGAPGLDGWYPEQRLSMAEAIYAFTQAAAFTSGQETRLGSVTPGKLADLTIFERDIFSIRPDELLAVGIAGTVVGGAFKYRTW